MHGWQSESTDGPKGGWSCVFWSACNGCSRHLAHNCWMQCGVAQLQFQLQCSVISVVQLLLQLWCGVMSVVQCNAVQSSLVWSGLMWCGAVWCVVVWCSGVQCSAVQRSVVQRNVVQSQPQPQSQSQCSVVQRSVPVVPHKAVAEVSEIRNIGEVGCCDSRMAERIH